MSPHRSAGLLSALFVLLPLTACSKGSGRPVAKVFLESEPNNGMAQANRVGGIDTRELWEIRGAIQSAGGEWDVFEFQALEDTLVSFRLIPEFDAEVVLLVTDAAGGVLLLLDEKDGHGELRGELTVTVADPRFMVVVYSLAFDTPYRVRVSGSDPIALPAGAPDTGAAGGTWTTEADWPALRAAQVAERLGDPEAAWSPAQVRAYELELGPDWEGPTRIDVTLEVD